MWQSDEITVEEYNALLAELNEAKRSNLELRERILDLERDLDNTRAEFDEYRSEDRRS